MKYLYASRSSVILEFSEVHGTLLAGSLDPSQIRARQYTRRRSRAAKFRALRYFRAFFQLTVLFYRRVNGIREGGTAHTVYFWFIIMQVQTCRILHNRNVLRLVLRGQWLTHILPGSGLIWVAIKISCHAFRAVHLLLCISSCDVHVLKSWPLNRFRIKIARYFRGPDSSKTCLHVKYFNGIVSLDNMHLKNYGQLFCAQMYMRRIL